MSPAMAIALMLAQQSKSLTCSDKNCLTISSTSVITAPPVATWTESVDKGDYKAVFDDPNNEWRCSIVSMNGEHMGNPFYQDPNVISVVCMKRHHVDGEPK